MRTREGRMIGVGPLAGGSDRRREAEILRRIRRRPRPRISLLILVGLAIAGLSALYLFADLIGALWRAETESQQKASEQQQEALSQEREQAERLNRDLAIARREIQALKAESARTLDASAEAIRPNQTVEVQSSSA